MWERVEELAQQYTCPYCLATPGVWCRTNRGARATALHYGRTDPIRMAWVDGWDEGRKDKEDELARRRTTTTGTSSTFNYPDQASS